MSRRGRAATAVLTTSRSRDEILHWADAVGDAADRCAAAVDAEEPAPPHAHDRALAASHH